jgi:hypothetical protein
MIARPDPVRNARQPDALEILEKQGLDQSAGTQEELAALIWAEVAKSFEWGSCNHANA